jgi:hypothetical protein
MEKLFQILHLEEAFSKQVPRLLPPARS